MRLDGAPGGEVAPGDYVMLSVTDTGEGMPPEVIERATEPFFTTKPAGKGTGLGLSMIYGFAKQSDGHMTIDSKVGQGTTVRLYLPRAGGVGASATDAEAPASDHRARGGETILVVDDNPELRQVSVRRLTGLGYTCVEADNGPDALALMDAGKRFDLLFTDIGLPDGMTGDVLAIKARERQPDLKVLYTTGYAKATQTGAGDEHTDLKPMLRKPYRGQELTEMVRALLGPTG